MPPKPNLQEALQKASGKPSASDVDDPEDSTANHERPSRTGKKMIAGYFDPEVSRQLKQIALDKDTTVQALIGEAINDLFTKHNKPPLA